MSRAWSGAPARLVLDDGARHTAENAAHAAQVARTLGARGGAGGHLALARARAPA